MNREGKVIILEQLLGVKFSQSYRDFILDKGGTIVDGYRVLGIPRKELDKEYLDPWSETLFSEEG